MKKTSIVILVLAAGRLYAIAPIGPAASTLEHRQVECGFEYANTKLDDLPVDFTFKLLGLTGSAEMPLSYDTDVYWAKLGYGLIDQADVFLRLGAADLDSSGMEFAWGLGVRATIVETERLDCGLVAQVNWFSGDDEGTIQDETFGLVSYSGDLSLRAIQIAAGPVYKGDGFSVYGGPFVYWIKGDGDIMLGDGNTTFGATFDVESDPRVGGYVGLSVAVKDNVNLAAEYQFAEHGRAFGCSLIYRF